MSERSEGGKSSTNFLSNDHKEDQDGVADDIIDSLSKETPNYGKKNEDILAVLSREGTQTRGELIRRRNDYDYLPDIVEKSGKVRPVALESSPFNHNLRDLQTHLQRRKEKISSLSKDIYDTKKELDVASQKPPLWKRLLGLGKSRQPLVYRKNELERKLKGLEHEYGREMERYKFESGQLKHGNISQASQDFREAA